MTENGIICAHHVLGQHTLASEDLALKKVPEDPAAMLAIAQAISQFNRLGTVDPTSLSLLSVSELHAVLGAEVWWQHDATV